jgi:hypothetical protein
MISFLPDNELNSETLLLSKALEPLNPNEIKELERIEKLNVIGFSEADIRAEIIDPIVRILGYQKGQSYSVDREKYIPFRGKKKYIDYSITLWEKNFWLIEAKKPNPKQPEFNYDELRQAVEYSVHPEIDAVLIVLCDGIKIEVFDRDQSLLDSILNIPINNIRENINSLRKILSPLQVWFFYRRRIIRSIDRAFEQEGNEKRLTEFSDLINSRLNAKRGQVSSNFRKLQLSNSNEYNDILKKSNYQEIINIHFYFPQTVSQVNIIMDNLLANLTPMTQSTLISKILPDSHKDYNDYYFMHSLEYLFRLSESKINIRWLPSWLTQGQDFSTDSAIKILINKLLTYFEDDLSRKIILLTANTWRRILKILSVVSPFQKDLANNQHLLTRFAGDEFSISQILSSPERNIILGLDSLTMMSTRDFVKNFYQENKTNNNLAKQRLQELWQFEKDLLIKYPNYPELLKESNLDEVHPTEWNTIRYDNLGHCALCVIKNHPYWKTYILENHELEIKTLYKIGSWAARDLLGYDRDEKINENADDDLLAERFFFGNKAWLQFFSEHYKLT